jgi:hypothetical protein
MRDILMKITKRYPSRANRKTLVHGFRDLQVSILTGGEDVARVSKANPLVASVVTDERRFPFSQRVQTNTVLRELPVRLPSDSR